MPIEKLSRSMSRVVSCSECGESQFTLYRVRGEDGKKVKPAKYICVECLKNENLRKV